MHPQSSSRIRDDRSRSLWHRVYESLLQKIAARHLEPGDWVSEVGTAEELAVSRTTVRAAMQTLIEEGILQRRPNGRCYVVERTWEEMCELFEIREVLEGLAARVSASRGDGAPVHALRGLCKAMDAAVEEGDASAFSQKDFEFHRQLIHGCGSTQLAYLSNADKFILVTMLYYPLLAKPPWARLRTGGAIPEHRGIVEAIEARDPKAAEAAARLHVEAAREDLKQAMQEAEAPKRKLVLNRLPD